MLRTVGEMKPITETKKYDDFMKLGRDLVNHLGTHLDVTVELVHFIRYVQSDETLSIVFDQDFKPRTSSKIDMEESRWCYHTSDGVMFEIPVSKIGVTADPMIKNAMQSAEGLKNLTESFYIKQRKAKEARDAQL
jgi:hypothetical protein